MRFTHQNNRSFTRNTLIPFLILGTSLTASAGTYTWQGTNALWGRAANWTPAGLTAEGPQPTDDIIIADLGTTSSLAVGAANRTARNLTFQRTVSDFLIGANSNSAGNFGYSFANVTTVTGSTLLTMTSSGGSVDNQRISFSIGSNLTIASTVNLGRTGSVSSDYNSTIGDFVVSGTTTISSGGVVNLSRSVSSTNTVGTVNFGMLQMAGGSLNLTAGSAANGSSTSIENVVTVNGLNGTSGVIQANKASTRASLVVDGGGNYSGTIADNAAGAVVRLTKNGTDALTLSGANSYTGTTQINAGTLLVNGNSAGATGAVTVAAGATLGGTGTLGGATTVSGIVAPGDGIGILTIANNVTWNGGVTASSATDWKFELGASQVSDLLSIQGNWLTGTGDAFRFDFSGSTALGTFTIVQWTGTTDFLASDFTHTNLGDGLTGEFTISGNTLQVTVVPEPGTYILVGVGVAALVLFRRRRLH